MHTESEGPDAFEDFIRESGAPYALHSDNTKMQTGLSFRKILRKYNIRSENTEPLHPQQNPAKCRIQDVKQLSTKIMDRTGTPAFLWFFCMLYVVMLLNFTALESLGWIMPHQACFENKGDTLAYWILSDNKQVLARSLVRPIDEHEVNKQTPAPGEILDPAVTEIEGSQQQTAPTMDLLSELVNSPMP
eukprot:2919163-Ditylum_brightwellii.AAC.1